MIVVPEHTRTVIILLYGTEDVFVGEKKCGTCQSVTDESEIAFSPNVGFGRFANQKFMFMN